ncbi:hypothetical protein RHMOL_Rhmol11G0111600 [Rhododendron molle]|uniref:Uncharacterized protein n=1 Tax=Rhododendron molle TaxID=49168 RepID=A0ACC0LRY2_RHOML|nr:hypothetical protein RHMOL_Rhmol11G0111600 [Rhododendron molle]
MHSTVLCTFTLSDCSSGSSDIISAMNDSRLLIAEMISESSDARFDGLEVRITMLCTSLHNTNPKS